MFINVREEKSAVSFDIEGRIEVDDVSDFCVIVDAYINRGYKHVLFNLTKVTHISTIAFGFFVATYKSIHEVDGYFGIYGIKSELKNVLDITQFTSVINFFNSEKEAKQDLDKFYRNKK